MKAFFFAASLVFFVTQTFMTQKSFAGVTFIDPNQTMEDSFKETVELDLERECIRDFFNAFYEVVADEIIANDRNMAIVTVRDRYMILEMTYRKTVKENPGIYTLVDIFFRRGECH